jgi:hypothetical protein
MEKEVNRGNPVFMDRVQGGFLSGEKMLCLRIVV